MTEPATAKGLVSFVGAGPGAADLITLRARDRLQRADVVVWASSLVPGEILAHCRPGTEIHDSSSMTLEDVLAVYQRNEGRRIVRLHSGDPSIYGAISEQIEWCVRARRPFEIVPGVSSLGAAAAAFGVELTVPGVSQSVVCTRLPGRTASSMREGESPAAFATVGVTMAVFLSASRPSELQSELLADGSAYTSDTPVGIAVRASRPDQILARTTLGNLARELERIGAHHTVLVLVGDVMDPGAAGARRSNLYHPDFAHGHRKRSGPGSTVGRPRRPD